MKENITFEMAQKDELDKIFNIYKKAIAEMDKNGIPQWDEIYPNKATLCEDIKNSHLYLTKINGDIACSYALNQLFDEEYLSGAWNYPNLPFYVIHRLCVNPDYQNKGIAKLTVEHIEEQVRDMGAQAIRLDAFTLNPYALKLYNKLGYTIVGTVRFRKGNFYLMEKRL